MNTMEVLHESNKPKFLNFSKNNTWRAELCLRRYLFCARAEQPARTCIIIIIIIIIIINLCSGVGISYTE